MDVKYQKKLAAKILKCGVNRVWIDDTMLDEVAEAITREDVRKLISSDAIMKKPKKGNSRGRHRYLKEQRKKGRRKGHGKRKGKKTARRPSKRMWITRMRSIRRELKHLRNEGHIDKTIYRRFYMKTKGGTFKDRADLVLHLKMEGHIDKDYKLLEVR